MGIRVRDVMGTELETVEPRMSVADLERALIKHRVSGFPVVEGRSLVGIVSRSDIVRILNVEHTFEEIVSDYYTVLSRGLDDPSVDALKTGARVGARVEGMHVADVMVKSILTAGPDQSLEDVAKILAEHGIHRLPVVEKGELVGIVTSLDLVRVIADGRHSEI